MLPFQIQLQTLLIYLYFSPLKMNQLAYYNRLPIADIGLERFNIFIPIQTSDQKLILEPNRSKGLSVW